MKHARYNWIIYFLSLLIVAFGQPAWSSVLAPIAATMGFALFWIAVACATSVQRFLLGTVWFGCVQAVQLSWMTSIEFQGYYILIVYVGLCFWLGLQFSLMNLLLPEIKNSSFVRILAAASLWVIIEWSRLSFLCGFTWNPVGLSLTAFLPTLQFASLWGIYGLSFWVIIVNLAAVKTVFSTGMRRLHNGIIWAILSLVPLFFGLWHLNRQSISGAKKFSAALVQTGLLPSQKVPLPGRYDEFVSPYDQWRRILRSLKDRGKNTWDLIVLPEAAVPLPAYEAAYEYSAALDCLHDELGDDALTHLPPLQSPFAERRWTHGKEEWYVSNAFWGQAIANIFRSEVIAGLDHHDPAEQKNYNAAFHFLPFQGGITRYDKRILLPLAEYLPFLSLKHLTKRYGISDFFSPGKEAKITGKRIPLSISICYEETFADLIREGRLKGAELLVNLTNDNFYPFSRLPKQHFDHARLRAVENGIPLLRACNTGITVAIDSFGRVLSQLGDGTKKTEGVKDALHISINVQEYSTFYCLWGDAGIVGLCCCILISFFQLRHRYGW